MSSYRPSARPTSRILQAAAAMSSQSTWPPSKAKMAEVVEQKMKLDLKESLIKSATSKWCKVLSVYCMVMYGVN